MWLATRSWATISVFSANLTLVSSAKVADRDVLPKLLMFSTESLLAFGSQLHVESVSWKHSHCGYAAKPVKFLSAMLMPSIFQSWNGHVSCSRVMQTLRVPAPGCPQSFARSTAPISPGNSLSLSRAVSVTLHERIDFSFQKLLHHLWMGDIGGFQFSSLPIICRAPKYWTIIIPYYHILAYNFI